LDGNKQFALGLALGENDIRPRTNWYTPEGKFHSFSNVHDLPHVEGILSRAKRAAHPRGPVGQMGFSFTLDEALEYFKGLKEIQNMIEAEERKEKEGSALD
jgi:hypothetical protein